MAEAIKREKLQIDATDVSLGRLASEIASKLIGKHKPTFESHRDHGDFVEIRNAAKIRITGAKLQNKKYFSYSGFPGGIKTRTLKDIMAKDPSDAVKRAVKNMLPKNRLMKERLKRLRVHND